MPPEANSRPTATSELLKLLVSLSPEETAQLIGVTPGTLEVWRSTKVYPLTYTKVGGKVRYMVTDVQKFLESRKVQCGEPTAEVRRRGCGQRAGRRRARNEAA